MEKLSLDNFQEYIKKNNYVIVKITADWCGPCKNVEPEVLKLKNNLNDDIKYIELDIDNNDDICDDLEITKVPTFINFINGEKTDVHVGANIEKIQALFDKTITHTTFKSSMF